MIGGSYTVSKSGSALSQLRIFEAFKHPKSTRQIQKKQMEQKKLEKNQNEAQVSLTGHNFIIDWVVPPPGMPVANEGLGWDPRA